MPRRSLPCGAAVPCRAVQLCAVMCSDACCAALTLLYKSGLIWRSIVQQYRGTPHQVRTYYIVESQKLHSQLSRPQRRAVRCRVVPCLVLRSGAVPCCALLSFQHTKQYQVSFFFSSHFYFPASGQAVVTGVVPSLPRFLPSILIAQRVQQSHRSYFFIECAN